MQNREEIPVIDIYSDGGARPNPGKGGFGVIMSYKKIQKEYFKGYRLTTNNRMELMGVIFALNQLKRKSIVNVYTDSTYIVNSINSKMPHKYRKRNWQKGENKKMLNYDLWDKLLKVIEQQVKVNFHWVKGHSDNPKNNRCDELATFGINSEELLEDKGYIPNTKSKNNLSTKKYLSRE